MKKLKKIELGIHIFNLAVIISVLVAYYLKPGPLKVVPQVILWLLTAATVTNIILTRIDTKRKK